MRDEPRVSVENACRGSNVVAVNRGASRVTGLYLPCLFPRQGSDSSLERNSYRRALFLLQRGLQISQLLLQ